MRALTIVLALTSAAHADDLTDAPPTGIDPDLQVAIDDAKAALARGDHEQATSIVLGIHESGDRFTKAQASLLTDPSRDILLAAANGASPQTQARALDGAWQLGGKHADPAYAKLLVDLAEREWPNDKSAALYLARRARVVDGNNAQAAALDSKWSNNQRRWVGLAIQLTGLAVAGAGIGMLVAAAGARDDLQSSVHPRAEADDLLAREHRFGMLGAISIGAGVGLFYGGIFYHRSGERDFEPESPAYLPALQESK